MPDPEYSPYAKVFVKRSVRKHLKNIIMNFFCPLLHHQWVKPHAANCPRLRRV